MSHFLRHDADGRVPPVNCGRRKLLQHNSIGLMHITETAVSLVSAKPVAPRPRCKSSVISRFPDSVVPRPFSVSLCVSCAACLCWEKLFKSPYEMVCIYIYIYVANDPAILGLGTRIATLYFSNSALLFSIASFPISNASVSPGQRLFSNRFSHLNFFLSPFLDLSSSIDIYSLQSFCDLLISHQKFRVQQPR